MCLQKFVEKLSDFVNLSDFESFYALLHLPKDVESGTLFDHHIEMHGNWKMEEYSLNFHRSTGF